MQRPGDVLTGDRQSGEFHVADLFGLQIFPGINPLLPQTGEVGFELAAFVFGVDEQQPRRHAVFFSLPSVLEHCEGELTLGQAAVVLELHAQFAFQWFDEFVVDFVDQFVFERFERGVAQKPAPGVGVVSGPGFGAIGHRDDPQGFGGQKLFRRRDGRMADKREGRQQGEGLDLLVHDR